MLVNATAMLQSAEKGHYGIGAFNTNNLEWATSILDAGEELQSPLIIQCTSGAAKWQTSFKLVADMVKDLVEAKNITVPVALHLDHGSYEAALECIDAGFTSVMYDGSHEKDFETNLAHTAEIVKLAHNKGISVEAEVGGIGGTEDGVTAKGELADPEQCKAIADLGVDFLACGIGNIHGIYPANWEGLSFDRLQEIKAKTGDLPLVLHGGTGIPVDQVKKAISLGISKINVNTDLQLVFAAATRKYIEEGLDKQGKGYASAQAPQARSRGHQGPHRGAHQGVWLRRQGLELTVPWVPRREFFSPHSVAAGPPGASGRAFCVVVGGAGRAEQTCGLIAVPSAAARPLPAVLLGSDSCGVLFTRRFGWELCPRDRRWASTLGIDGGRPWGIDVAGMPRDFAVFRKNPNV